MVWEFPAVSQSRKEFWGEPQYTRFGMWIFTLLFGFWGLHHIMLRSPQTAIMCCVVNIMTFGYWYFYDLIQLSSEEYGGLGDDGLNTYGLSAPWGPLGIAQGMWIAPHKLSTQKGGNNNSTDTLKPDKQPSSAMGKAAGDFIQHGLGLILDWFMSTRPSIPKIMEPPGKKDPWYFFLYAITSVTGILSALFAGDKTNAFFRLTLCMAFPILICVILYDVFMLVLFPASAVFNGMARPFPFNIFNSVDLDGRSPLITCTQENPTDPESLKKVFKTWIGMFQEGAALTEAGLAYVPAAAPAALLGELKDLMQAYTAQIKRGTYKEQQQQLPLQKGGGEEYSFLPGLTTATIAAVIGGGIFLGASRLYVEGKDDSPPNTGSF